MQFYQVVFKQTFLGEAMGNTFFFRAPDEGASAEGLSLAFVQDMLSKINAFQHFAVKNSLLRIINLNSLSDFWETTLTGQGAVSDASPTLPLFVAVNYTLRCNTRAVRPGKKRFSGLAQVAQNAGTFSDSGTLTAMNALRVALGQPVVVEPGTEYSPIVVKRVKVTDIETGEVTYRLPSTTGEVVYGDVTGVLLNTRVSHQSSRGNGQ